MPQGVFSMSEPTERNVISTAFIVEQTVPW